MAASAVSAQMNVPKRGLTAQAGAYVAAGTASKDKSSTITNSDQDFARAAPDSELTGKQADARLACGILNEYDTEMPQSLSGLEPQEADPYQQLSASAALPQQETAAAVPEPTAAKPKATRHKATCSKKVGPPAAAVLPRTSKRNKKPPATLPQPLEQAGHVAKAAQDTLDPDSPKQPAATRGRKAHAGPSQSPSKKAKSTGDKAAVKPPANKKRKLDSAPTADITAVPEASQVYEYAPGEEPYRAVGVDVNEAEVLDVAARAQVSKAQDQYSKMYREARVIEDARHAAAGGVNPQGKAISKRPDLVARTKMEKAGATVNTRKVAGHLPGIAIFDRFYLRAEMGVVGMHFSPLGGIDYISKSAIAGCPQYATSIMVCGGYEDDADDGHELTYTGQGGNDLLGNRQQNGEQQLRLGNLALVGNIQLGIPVRVTRRNIEQDAICGAVFIYDGLYNVVKYWLEKGKKGFSVYKYLLRRRPDQGDLATSRVEFGGKSAPKGLSALTRPGVFDVDISCGKEPRPIVGVNEVNEEVVPFSEANQILTEQDMKGNPLTHLITEGARASHKRALEYITSSIPVQGGVQPTVPVLPAKMTRCPHTYLEYLNGGLLPYHDRSAGSKVKHSQARRVQSVLYECGPWANCPDGPACCQAASQQEKMLLTLWFNKRSKTKDQMGCQYRLEVFQTSNKGWGIRSWDTIPNGAFVMNYTGKTKAIDEVGDDDMNYTFDLAPRPYSQGDEELPLFPKSMWETHKQAKYILDAKHEGNVARFINHSCDPNLYVQPVLSHHHDISQTQVCLFAGHNIAPMTELTFDYGHGFLKDNLKGNCNCGTAMCVGPDIKHQIEEEEQEEECRETEKVKKDRRR